ncbi:MAG: uroporphyrinogen-III synthase [Gemmatimonadaceae bacterium]
MPGLNGRRVLVTRAPDDAEQWAARLASLGAVPVLLPCLTFASIDGADVSRQLRNALQQSGWLLLASPRGAEVAGAVLEGQLPPHVRVAVIGPATAAAARRHLGRVDFEATQSSSAGLGQELATAITREGLLTTAARGRSDAKLQPGAARSTELAEPDGIVVVGAVGGREDAELALRGAGLSVTRVDLYRTIPVPSSSPKRSLESEGIQDVLLASPSAVTGLMNAAVVPTVARVITIGPTTSAAARAAGLTVAAEAPRPSLEGMIEVMQ